MEIDPELMSDGKTPEQAGRDDAREAFKAARKILRACARAMRAKTKRK